MHIHTHTVMANVVHTHTHTHTVIVNVVSMCQIIMIKTCYDIVVNLGSSSSDCVMSAQTSKYFSILNVRLYIILVCTLGLSGSEETSSTNVHSSEGNIIIIIFIASIQLRVCRTLHFQNNLLKMYVPLCFSKSRW